MGYVITGNKMEFTAIPSLPYTNNGITWSSPSANHFHAQGSASANSILRLVDTMNIPSWIEYDKQYNIYFDRTGNTSNVVWYIQLQKNSDLSWVTVFYGYRDGSFTIPSEPQGYRQLGVILRVYNGNSANETVHPYLIKTVPYTPRFNDNGMRGSIYYSGTTGGYYAMPNCTRYCYGRWWEIMGQQPTGLANLGNAKDWWNGVTLYQKGQTPALGAIMCFSGGGKGLGHVAVVERIDSDGTVWSSNSGYLYEYFYIRKGQRSNPAWKPYGQWDGRKPYVFQGFIYLPDEYSPTPTPDPDPTPSGTPKPLWFYLGRWPF